MENTYTYTARSAQDPNKIVTFTLHDDRMSVDIGTPIEQVTQVLTAESEDETEIAPQGQVWLKPLAVSLVERRTQPLRVVDVDARLDDDRLLIKSWVRLSGLRLAPITLMTGRIDNPDSAAAFVEEVNTRKDALASNSSILNLLDFWLTWFAAALSLFGLFHFWMRHSAQERS